MKVTIVGGGVVGLCTAYYLQKDGFEVTVLNDTALHQSASNGNMGYICRSHLVPMANPQKLAQGLLMLFKSNSPFYIRPTLDFDMIGWLIKFILACRPGTLPARMTALKALNGLSVDEYFKMEKALNHTFTIHQKGLLMITAQEQQMDHLAKEYQVNQEYEINSRLLSKNDIRTIDPNLRSVAIGGLYFPEDCHINPTEFMMAMKKHLLDAGVIIMENTTVKAFELNKNRIAAVKTATNTIKSDYFVMSVGSWSAKLLKPLRKKMCLIPAKGYSITLPEDKNNFTTPFIIVEKTVAGSLFNGNVRFGSTLEIGRHDGKIHPKRTQTILKAVKDFLPDYPINTHAPEEFWYGYRPCSYDGLPFISRDSHYDNLFTATGNGMLGMTQGPGTAKLVAEMINGKTASIDLSPFDPNR